MKKKTGNKIKLGVFVFTGLVILITGIYFIGKKQQLFSTTFRISGIFNDISGLQVGDNVRFSGINVGIIVDIQQVSDTTVKVDMLIVEKSRKFIKKNSTATIGSDGIMGNKIVVIIPGKSSSQVIADNDILETAKPVSVDDILMKIKVTSENAASITGDLAAIMNNLRSGKGTIGKLFVDTMLAQNVNDAMVNIKQGAGSFQQNMEAVKHNVFLKGFFKRKEKENQKGKTNQDTKNKKEKTDPDSKSIVSKQK